MARARSLLVMSLFNKMKASQISCDYKLVFSYLNKGNTKATLKVSLMQNLVCFILVYLFSGPWHSTFHNLE